MFWDTIDWNTIEKHVTKLQFRIVKAIQKLKKQIQPDNKTHRSVYAI